MGLNKEIKVAELFAGVGGFRLALEGYDNPEEPDLAMPSAGPFNTVWANQWEPPGTERKQYAWRCYEERFGKGSCVNEDIKEIVNKLNVGEVCLPQIELLVAGFPCQDYSVAKPLRWSRGIKGEKGVLWWAIYEILKAKQPRYILLENVDRLIRGKASNNGRDFAMILASLNKLNYSVEWRVINAADYGYPQKRRRVYIFGVLNAKDWELNERLIRKGVLAEAFPIKETEEKKCSFLLSSNPNETSKIFETHMQMSPFQNGGIMQHGEVLTARVFADYDGDKKVLRDVLESADNVPDEYYIEEDKLADWAAARASKRRESINRDGIKYTYIEGSMKWPDPIDEPARTILTGESGKAASRMKHAIKDETGNFRRLVPDELDQLQGFPKGWTNIGMTDSQRAFCMGNALVVQIPHTIGKIIAKRHTENEM